MNFMTNVVDHLEAILQQKAHEADRKLSEAINRTNVKLRDINAFAGTAPVECRQDEYEKDIEYRRDTFLSIVKRVISVMNAEQGRELSPALNDLARRWLGQHITRLQEELDGLATRLHVHDSKLQDLGFDRIFAYIDTELQLILSSPPVELGTGEVFIDPERLSQLRSIKRTHPADVETAFGSGAVYDFYRSLNKIIASAEKSLFIIDPYLDYTLFDHYLSSRQPDVSVRLLLSCSPEKVKTAVVKYIQQFGSVLEARKSKAFHDRVIFIDRYVCWVMGQSVKDAAKSKPTYLVSSASDIVPAKLQDYEQIWEAANAI